ncbi:hypothetical protein AHiyo8_43330 [Arthrobacter sp. Hiyo8]|nr:hypothetical protein AHiyo8_43330 [Arthrobacter sp. Hiyo8]
MLAHLLRRLLRDLLLPEFSLCRLTPCLAPQFINPAVLFLKIRRAAHPGAYLVLLASRQPVRFRISTTSVHGATETASKCTASAVCPPLYFSTSGPST